MKNICCIRKLIIKIHFKFGYDRCHFYFPIAANNRCDNFFT